MKIVLTHPDKIYWPKEKYTKKDLMKYYQEVSTYILPFLKNRPMVLRRFPNGIEGKNFIQKNTKNINLPEWVKVKEINHENKTIPYFLIQDKATLEYVVNLGTIELHPFNSHVGKLDYPDYFIIDMDPESVSFQKVIETAQVIHQLLDSWEIPHYCKTSGGRGLHVYIPLHAKYNMDQISKFGKIIGMLIREEMPKIISLERSPAKRQGKIYIDVLQNRSKQTVVAPYSVRGRPKAMVSTPLYWDEVKKGMKPGDFTIETILPRLKDVGEIFFPVLGKGFNMKKWVENMGENDDYKT